MNEDTFDSSTDYNRSQEFSQQKDPLAQEGSDHSGLFKETNSSLYFLILYIRSIKFKTSNAEQTLALEHFETNFRIESRNALWGRIQSGSKASLVHPRQTFPFALDSRFFSVIQTSRFSLHFAKPGDCIFRQESID